MTEGAVYIGPLEKKGRDIIRDYYERCGLETIGPMVFRTNDVANRIPVKSVETFANFEELLDKMLLRPEWVQIIVSHGDPDRGLIMPLARTGGNTATGGVIHHLAALAEEQAARLARRAAPIGASEPNFSGRIKDAASKMNVPEQTILDVTLKLGRLHQRKFIVEIRGCRLAKAQRDAFGGHDLLEQYRKAFGHMTTAPTCWMLYVAVSAHAHKRTEKMEALKKQTPPSPNRRRFFDAQGKGGIGPIIIDIARFSDAQDHTTRVDSEAILSDPAHAIHWANRFLTLWKQAPNNRFVVPVMWETGEAGFHLPLEPGWCAHLRMVP